MIRQGQEAGSFFFSCRGWFYTTTRERKKYHAKNCLIDFASSGKPFLGICLGLQLLLENTEEGNAACLGIVSGSVKKLPKGLKVPHMGWNNITFSSNHPILTDIPKDSFFYFVHSYYAEPGDQQAIAGNSHYGLTFCSIYAKDNLVATQFHPEKSGPIGLKIYENFRNMTIRNTW